MGLECCITRPSNLACAPAHLAHTYHNQTILMNGRFDTSRKALERCSNSVVLRLRGCPTRPADYAQPPTPLSATAYQHGRRCTHRGFIPGLRIQCGSVDGFNPPLPYLKSPPMVGTRAMYLSLSWMQRAPKRHILGGEDCVTSLKDYERSDEQPNSRRPSGSPRQRDSCPAIQGEVPARTTRERNTRDTQYPTASIPSLPQSGEEYGEPRGFGYVPTTPSVKLKHRRAIQRKNRPASIRLTTDSLRS